MQAQQLIDEHETQKQLAELPLIPMPILPTPTISVRINQLILFTFFINIICRP